VTDKEQQILEAKLHLIRHTRIMIKILSQRKIGQHPELARYRQGASIFVRSSNHFL